MNYKEYQNALKNLRNTGYDVLVKLNSKLEILKAEYDRLTIIPEPLRQLEPLTATQFNEMVGFPTEPLVVIQSVNSTSEDLEQLETIQVIGLAICDNNSSLEALEPLGAIQDETLAIAETNTTLEPTEVIENRPKAPDSKGFSHPKVCQEVLHQPETIQAKALGIFQLSISNLEPTQQQAIRNLQDGWRSLKNLGRNLKAFKTGFDEGLRLAEAAKKSKASPEFPVSALKPSKRPNKVIELSTPQHLPRAA